MTIVNDITDWTTFYNTYTYLQGKQLCSVITGLGYVWMYSMDEEEPYVTYDKEQDVHILVEVVNAGRVYRTSKHDDMTVSCESITARIHTTLGYYLTINIEEHPDTDDYEVQVSEPVNNN